VDGSTTAIRIARGRSRSGAARYEISGKDLCLILAAGASLCGGDVPTRARGKPLKHRKIEKFRFRKLLD
jgi:hypothetical protein